MVVVGVVVVSHWSGKYPSVWCLCLTATEIWTRGQPVACLSLHLHPLSVSSSRMLLTIWTCVAPIPTTRRPLSLPGRRRRRFWSSGFDSTGTCHLPLPNRYDASSLLLLEWAVVIVVGGLLYTFSVSQCHRFKPAWVLQNCIFLSVWCYASTIYGLVYLWTCVGSGAWV